LKLEAKFQAKKGASKLAHSSFPMCLPCLAVLASSSWKSLAQASCRAALSVAHGCILPYAKPRATGRRPHYWPPQRL